MDAERWQRAKAVFSAALAVDLTVRDGVLNDLCAGDARLREEVSELLRAHDSAGFVDELANRLARPDRSASNDPSTPARIGRYEVLTKIGRGGMGVVYKARDARLDRLVAIKVLSPGRYAEAPERQRLLTEARAAAALDHPSIAPIFEVDETEDVGVFLVMAFYDGDTLDARIAHGPMPPSDACRIARDIADALAAAHARGITHRDLKPPNILLTRSGSVKLLDFGVAKIVGVDQTQVGQVLGTIAYMAPEQKRGERVDSRVDVWALGIVLHEMLTGERPKTADPRSSIPQGSSLLSSTRSEIPEGLDRIIRRALSLRPDDRYRDGAELRDALTRWIESSGGNPPVP